jgi:hypothetical protein
MIVSYCVLWLLHLNIVLLFDMTFSTGVLREIVTRMELYNTGSTVIYLGLCS